MFGEIGIIIGQILSIVAVVTGVISFQMKTSKGILFFQIITALVVFTSLLTWDGWYSAFIMLGLLINSIGFSSPNAQIIRKLNLIKSPLCLVYNLCVSSPGGIIFETSSIISTVIGLVKNRKKTNNNVLT